MNAHVDTFARDHLPPKEQWPNFINLDRFEYPETLNCATPLLDNALSEGHGDRLAVIMSEGQWTYAELQADANRIARVLIEDFGVEPGIGHRRFQAPRRARRDRDFETLRMGV